MPFYVWVVTLIVLMADLTYSLVHQEYSWWTIGVLCVGSLATCVLQFMLGKYIGMRLPAATKGEDYRDVLINPEAANYSMAQVYLLPVVSMAPAAYIIWQNIFNSIQLSLAGRRKAPV